jgi:hypothetical protein
MSFINHLNLHLRTMHVRGVPKPFQQLIHAQTFKGTVSRDEYIYYGLYL